MKRALPIFLCLALVLLSGCGEAGSGGADLPSPQAAVIQADLSGLDLEFTAQDLDVGYEETTVIQVALQGETIQVDGTGTQAQGSTLKITESGDYVLSGSLADGQILVEAGDQDVVHLILDGAVIHCETGPALLIDSAGKLLLTLKGGTENTLTGGKSTPAEERSSLDGVVFSRTDLTLNGEGSLTVDASCRHGIVSKGSLVITGGSYRITAPGQGLSGKDCVKVAGGSFDLTTGGDGIQSSGGEDADQGYIYLQNGEFSIDAGTDAIQAETVLKIDGGVYTLTASGGGDETASAKGLKAGELLLITEGTFSVDASDDAVHCNGDVMLSGGELILRSGDDGIHADSAVWVADGALQVVQSYEGLEGQCVTISGGELEITAQDDGLNAVGDGAFIRITGGVLTVDAGGDGLDSNGDLYVEGGTVTVYGPEDDANSAVDYDGTATVSGGTVVAAGSAAMAQGFSEESSQCSVLIDLAFQVTAETEFTLMDGEGAIVLRGTPAKRYQSILLSSPDLERGETYTFTAGDQSVEVTLTKRASSVGETGGLRRK